jgi:transketolase
MGGTADLNGPCLKEMKTFDIFNPENQEGNFFNYGVREHGMAAISNGMQLYDPKNTVYCSTFLSFVDYLRPSLRLSALMEIPVIYNLAYDSVYTGEDGPTHQPVEQLASVRCMPNVSVIRPGDAQEGVVCAQMVIKETDGPVCCITTRQKLNCYAKDDANWEQNMSQKGAYIVRSETEALQAIVVATGSEVNTALSAVEQLGNSKNIRVVSMPCREKFYGLQRSQREEIIPFDVQTVVVEAAAEQGWSELSDRKVHFIGISEFGTSAPGPVVAMARGIDANSVADKLQGLVGNIN